MAVDSKHRAARGRENAAMIANFCRRNGKRKRRRGAQCNPLLCGPWRPLRQSFDFTRTVPEILSRRVREKCWIVVKAGQLTGLSVAALLEAGSLKATGSLASARRAIVCWFYVVSADGLEPSTHALKEYPTKAHRACMDEQEWHDCSVFMRVYRMFPPSLPLPAD